MGIITILAMFAILAGTAILTTTGLAAFVSAQTTMENVTMAGNMTAGNMTNDTGSISWRGK